MKRRHLIARVATAAALALGGALAAPAWAQGDETTLHIVVPYPPGGASDRAARLIAERLGPRLKQTVVVENRAGAGGRVAMQQLKSADARQNVLVLANPATMVIAPLVFKDNGYDPQKDFQPVAQVSEYEVGGAVPASMPVKDFAQLVDWLRANPRQANFGVPATGSLPHFFGLMVEEKAQVDAEVVGYRGSAPLVSELIGGMVPVAFDTLDALLPQHEGGKLRVLASSGEQRTPFARDIPTFREAGLDMVATGWNTLFAPAAMPRDKVQRLGAAVQAVMQDEQMQRQFAANQMTAVASDAAQTAQMLERYRAQWAPVVQKSGYRP